MEFSSVPPPKEYSARGGILFHNGFGIQCAGNGTELVCIVAELNDENNGKFLAKLSQIKIDSACQSVGPEDWIGHDFVAVHWTETDKIDNVIAALLGNDITLTYFCRLKPTIRPSDIKSRPWSQDVLEECIIRAIRSLNERLDWNTIATVIGPSFLKEWNWKSDQGILFCRECRKMLKKRPSNKESKHNYWTWDIFQNCDPKHC